MNIFNNLTKIADLLTSDRTGKQILSLYRQNNKDSVKFYLFDLVILDNKARQSHQYHVYETTKDNIRKFLDFKTNTHLMPKENQMIYMVHYFDNEVLNVQKYSKDLKDIILSASFDGKIYEECSEESKELLKTIL
jgi:hypothetical protein